MHARGRSDDKMIITREKYLSEVITSHQLSSETLLP